MTTGAHQGPSVAGRVEPHTARVRCHKCATTKITASCCRCGRYVCSKHDRVADYTHVARRVRDFLRRLQSRLAGRSAHMSKGSAKGGRVGGSTRSVRPGHVTIAGKPDGGPGGPASQRGRNQQASAHPRADTPRRRPVRKSATAWSSPDDIPKMTKARHFCGSCAPVGTHHDPIVIRGTVVAALGAMLLPTNIAVALVLIGLSVSRILLRISLGVHRWIRNGNRLATMRLDPRIAELKAVETLRAKYVRDAEEMHFDFKGVSGVIRAELVWSRAQASEARRFRQKRPGLTPENRRAVAGTFVLIGDGQLEVTPPRGCETTRPGTVQLRPMIDDHPFLHTGGRGDPRWKLKIPYKLLDKETPWTSPVWITPSITPDSDRHAFELRVQWQTRRPGDDLPDRSALLAKEITSLKVLVPSTWGDVDQIASSSDAEEILVGLDDEGNRVLEWRHVALSGESSGSCTLSTSFDGEIGAKDKVSGKAVVRFRRTLSGLEKVRVHAAQGGRRPDGTRCSVRTKVILDFDISLDGLRYQELRTVPDQGRDDLSERPEGRRYERAVPNAYTVARLTDLLSRDGYYVKSVEENPPQAGHTVGVLNRVWDITGRRYNGLHPTGFHITLQGEETQPGAPSSPHTIVQLSVRGACATNRMEEVIIQVYDELWERIEGCLRGLGADAVTPVGEVRQWL